MLKPTIPCPACGKEMRLDTTSGFWELEHGPLTIGEHPQSVIARKKWIYVCHNCKTRVEYVEIVATYKLDESSIKEF